MREPMIDLIATIPSQCTLGEGPVWDHRTGSLWFTDIQEAQLLRLDWGSGELERFELPERLGSLGLTPDLDRLVCAFASGFATYRPESGEIEWLHRTEPHYRGIRMNDGRIDRQGRFWAGSMVEREEGAPEERGALWMLDGTCPELARQVLNGISISNSICFSPCGEHIYLTDTPSQIISRYELEQGGLLGEGTEFARLNGNAYPDGSDIDAEGRLWNAEWGSGRITAYNSDGSHFASIDLPVSQATCVAFGGPELDLLFVTTARDGLSPDQLGAEPNAGDVLVYRTEAKGLPAPLFKGLEKTG